jgi:hypothetical protein
MGVKWNKLTILFATQTDGASRTAPALSIRGFTVP